MKVTLVGAGPGDKGLLTIIGERCIQNADVVLYDSLASDEILDIIPDSAEKIDVGKHAGKHPVPQSEINRLLLEKARQGKNVVRLKGGDPFVFGRGGEELQFLAENNIPFEVIPGISSAIAAAAYAGIPVTHRNYSSSLHIITAHSKNDETPNINYDALVKLNGTLVFMMGVATIIDICDGCVAAGMKGDMPAAIVENATTNFQRKFLGTVKTLPAIASENAVESPAIIIIGEVCRLSECCDWFSKKPLHGKCAIVARVKFGQSMLSNKLRELGCHVIDMPCVEVMPLTGVGCPLKKAMQNIDEYSWLVFTSRVGVNIFFDYLIASEIDVRSLRHLKIACVGSETKKEITKRGIKVEYFPSEFNGAALACGLAKIAANGEKLLIARAKNGAEDLTNILASAGVAFDDVPIYEKIKNTKSYGVATAIAKNKIDFVAFTSPFAVEGFAEAVPNIDFKKIKAVCLGKQTADAAKSFDMATFVPNEASFNGMIDKIKELYHGALVLTSTVNAEYKNLLSGPVTKEE